MIEDTDPFVEHRKLIVAGSGISELSSAIYAVRSNNEPLMLEGDEPDGQLTLTTEVDNYPGFPKGVSSLEFINNMKEQAERFSMEIRHGIIEDVDAPERPFTVTLENGDMYTADALIAASGVSARTLSIPGEENLTGHGLSVCATCDGVFPRDEKIMVIGGGGATVKGANFPVKFISTIYLVHRHKEFRAEDYQADRLTEEIDEGGIEFMLNTEVTELYGSPKKGVDHVTLVRNPEGRPSGKSDDPKTEEFNFDVDAVFYAIGYMPSANYLDGTGIQRSDDGYIVAKGGSGSSRTATNVPDIFATGDAVDYHYQQAAIAGGMGMRTAFDADDYLEELEHEEKQAAVGATE